MAEKIVCVFAGDGVGPEVIAEAIKILKSRRKGYRPHNMFSI